MYGKKRVRGGGALHNKANARSQNKRAVNNKTNAPKARARAEGARRQAKQKPAFNNKNKRAFNNKIDARSNNKYARAQTQIKAFFEGVFFRR